MSERKKFDKAFIEQNNMIIWYYIFKKIFVEENIC